MSGSPPSPAVRPLRADAARNRARILDAAKSAFAEGGLDVGVEEIARRAGVGKGTLYRRFPTKEALIRAIFQDGLDELDAMAEQALAAADPWKGFAEFLADASSMQARNQGFLDVVGQRMGPSKLTPELRDRFLASVGGPLKRAQSAGVIRPDLQPRDVAMLLRMVGATSRPALDGEATAGWPRYHALVLDALRPGAATPLPG